MSQDPSFDDNELHPGKIVFFKAASLGSHPKSPSGVFQGKGFGLLLGHVPPGLEDPPPDWFRGCFGQFGLCYFDDIAEFLGEEAATTVIQKYNQKYYPPKIADDEPEVEAKPKSNIILTDLDS